jgi:hypothetical protein
LPQVAANKRELREFAQRSEVRQCSKHAVPQLQCLQSRKGQRAQCAKAGASGSKLAQISQIALLLDLAYHLGSALWEMSLEGAQAPAFR